jgi:UDP-N-acetylglucosamine 4,6-dehydratase
MKGGENFIPKIPSMKIIDLAMAIAPKAKLKTIGIRPGEKIHEILLTEDEANHSKEFSDSYVIEPEHPFWKEDFLKGGKKLEPGFRYTSNKNKSWLTNDQLMKIIKEL